MKLYGSMVSSPRVRTLLDYIAYLSVRGVFAVLSLIPYRAAIQLVYWIVRLVFAFLPRYRAIAFKNLELAFPTLTHSEHKKIVIESCRSLARLIIDFAQFRRFTPQWISEHIEFPPEPILAKVRAKEKGRPGIIFATGHLGSFELLAYAAAMQGFPMGFVVRNFKNQKLDRWWNGQRERSGNSVISRRGAFKVIFENISEGDHVGLLFDQNVTLKHAVFVDFFGRPAATTKTIGLVAARTKAPVMVVSMTHKGDDYYRINLKECDFTSLYDDESVDIETKVRLITQEVSSIYEDMIRSAPGEWFWMHRRWKTAPPGTPEDFYTRPLEGSTPKTLVREN